MDQGVPQAKRWVVGRTYGILMLHRRLVRRVVGPESVLVSRGRRLWGSGRRRPGHGARQAWHIGHAGVRPAPGRLMRLAEMIGPPAASAGRNAMVSSRGAPSARAAGGSPAVAARRASAAKSAWRSRGRTGVTPRARCCPEHRTVPPALGTRPPARASGPRRAGPLPRSAVSRVRQRSGFRRGRVGDGSAVDPGRSVRHGAKGHRTCMSSPDSRSCTSELRWC